MIPPVRIVRVARCIPATPAGASAERGAKAEEARQNGLDRHICEAERLLFARNAVRQQRR